MLKTFDDARFWDRTARKYAREPIRDKAGYSRTLERTQELLDASHSVVEIGCGTGTTALKLAPYVTRILATDISGEMVAIAREKAAEQSCANAVFTVAEADYLVDLGRSFDAALAFNILHLVPDRAAVLAEMFRVLKPGGLFISKTPCLSEMNPLIRLAVPVMRLVGKAPFVASFSAGELEADIAAAGFIIQTFERHGSGRRDPRIFLVARKPDARPKVSAGR